MSSPHSVHEAWRPQSRQEREAVLRELELILASPHFCNSRRYPALLRYLVENSLNGKVDLLKERTLGVEVFERPADYDTSNDTVVRYTAGEVRKRLMLYYSEQTSPSSIRISLPTGSYIPEFHRAHSDSSEEGGGAVVDAVASVFWWRSRVATPVSVVAQFWEPALRGQQSVVVCTGSVVFASERNYSGVITADRDIDYPFVSWQGALAISNVSGVLSSLGVSTQLASAPSTPLTYLREHTVVLLGAYNNQWTMHLQQPLRFSFLPGADEVIRDRLHPQVQWKRDQSQPYSSADDYAVIARF